MSQFHLQFNCCKTFNCNNFGVIGSRDYISETHHLGYPAIYCPLCGGYPPIVDDSSVNQLIEEKIAQHYSQHPCGCPHCLPRFFQPTPLKTRRYGYTSAKQQRLVCQQCSKVFTAPHWPYDPRLTTLLQGVIAGHSPQHIMQQLMIPSKIYYQLLQRLALGLRFFSRQQESRQKQKTALRLITESQSLQFSGAKRLWCLATAEASTGYLFLLNHNMSQKSLNKSGGYQSRHDTQLSSDKQRPILDTLKARYQQTLSRTHFEDLNYGMARPVSGAYLAKPSLLAYAHFQMLRPLTDLADHYHHYIEHDSCIRSAALMGGLKAIGDKRAEVFYLLRHHNPPPLPESGHDIGWWRDRWYPAPFGAYCPITYRTSYPYAFLLERPQACQAFFNYLHQALPAQLRSFSAFTAQLEILRYAYNWMLADDKKSTPAIRMGMTNQVFDGETAVEKMTQAINREVESNKKILHRRGRRGRREEIIKL